MHLSCHAWHGDSLVIMNTVFGTCILRWKWSSSQNTNIPSVRNTLNTWTSCYLQGNIPFANSFVWKVYESEAGLNCYFVLFQVSFRGIWLDLDCFPHGLASSLRRQFLLDLVCWRWHVCTLCCICDRPWSFVPFKSIRLLTHNLTIHFTRKP